MYMQFIGCVYAHLTHMHMFSYSYKADVISRYVRSLTWTRIIVISMDHLLGEYMVRLSTAVHVHHDSSLSLHAMTLYGFSAHTHTHTHHHIPNVMHTCSLQCTYVDPCVLEADWMTKCTDSPSSSSWSTDHRGWTGSASWRERDN